MQKRRPNYTNANVQIKDSKFPNGGHGLFVNSRIPPNNIVTTFEGPVRLAVNLSRRKKKLTIKIRNSFDVIDGEAVRRRLLGRNIINNIFINLALLFS